MSPIDPLERQRYVEPVYNDGQANNLDQIYNVTTLQEYYINLAVDGNLSWKSASYCTSDLREALENWKNKVHEVSMRSCAKVTRSMQ